MSSEQGWFAFSSNAATLELGDVPYAPSGIDRIGTSKLFIGDLQQAPGTIQWFPFHAKTIRCSGGRTLLE